MTPDLSKAELTTLGLLFVLVDNLKEVVEAAWLGPSTDFDQRRGCPTTRANYRFSATISADSGDIWLPYRVTSAELLRKIIERLEQLEK